MEWLPSDFWESCVLVCTSWMLVDRMCYICVLQGSELFPILRMESNAACKSHSKVLPQNSWFVAYEVTYSKAQADGCPQESTETFCPQHLAFLCQLIHYEQ